MNMRKTLNLTIWQNLNWIQKSSVAESRFSCNNSLKCSVYKKK
nr:MAG TPA: hypothetical protein [Bacteriophage sp.]